MPMAKKNLNTVARLAMGTAMLTVISACDSRVANNSYTDIMPMPSVGGVTPAQTTTVVITPSYVTPGAPTYVESSQAANVQTFESIYGQPVSQAASGSIVASQPYTPPSYNDGTVVSQSLPAPVALTYAESTQPTYTQQTMAAVEPMTYTAAPEVIYSDAPVMDDSLVYGDTLVSSSYRVETVAEPAEIVPSSTSTYTMIEDFAAPAPVAMETYALDDMPAMEPAMMAPTPQPMEPLGFEAESSMPSPIYSEMSSTYSEALPMTDAMAMPADTMMVETMPETMAPMAPMAPMAQPMPMDGGFQIISNEEALTTYDSSAPMPSMDGLGDQSGLMPMPMPVEPTLGGAYAVTAPAVDVAVLAVPVLESSPLPRSKNFVTAATVATVAVAAPVDTSLAMAPVPRPRPAKAAPKVAAKTDKADEYATLTAPLPQPRPDYKKPMAVATSSGTYVSIGALSDAPGFEINETLETAMVATDTVDKAAPVAPSAPAVLPVQEASIRTAEAITPSAAPSAAVDTSGSELSGTSWRLIEVGATPVSVNAELHFDGASGFAGGQGPCNSYGGEFTNVGEGKFSMANIFSTETACSSIELEKKYLEALGNADRYEIAPGFSDLTLLDESGSKIAQFKAF